MTRSGDAGGNKNVDGSNTKRSGDGDKKVKSKLCVLWWFESLSEFPPRATTLQFVRALGSGVIQNMERKYFGI